ncbi:MAG: tripartite tricarboxylate transporter TctB family protein [Pseudomonadota bacterium]
MNDRATPPAKSRLAGLPQDFYLGLVIMLFGGLLLLWIIPAQVNDAGSFGLPPSLAPKALAWVMILCGGVLAAQHMRSAPEDGGLQAGQIAFLASCLLAVGLMLVLMSYAGRMLDRPNAGFLMSAPFGLIAFTYLHSRAPVWAYAFNAIVAPLIIVAAFWWGLELPLP